MFHRILPLVVVDVGRIIYQSLGLILDVRPIINDLGRKLLQLFFFGVYPVARDPTPFMNVSRSVGVLSVGPISIIYHRDIFIWVVYFEFALFKSTNKAEKPSVSVPCLIP